jgi:hypothetical protein
VTRQSFRGIEAQLSRPSGRASVDERSGGARRAILAVRSRGKERDLGAAVESERSGKGELEVAPAGAENPSERDRRFPAGEQKLACSEESDP